MKGNSTAMSKILFLAAASDVHTSRWANAIAQNGQEVHLLSLHPAGEPLDPRVVLHRAPYGSKVGYFTNWPWAGRVVRQLAPDLLHVWYASGYGTLGALLDFHPTVMSVFGTDVFKFPHLSRWHKALLEFNLSRADRILSCSHTMAEATRQFTHRSVEVVPWGVDLTRFRPQQVPSLFTSEDIVIGTVKKLEETYGIKYLIQAFALLKQKLNDWPLKLLIVGKGVQESYLKHLAQDLGVAQDTIFTGYVPHTDVPRYQNMLTISVSVSLSESFGVSVIEACACEKPVVVSSVGGLPEVVEHGVTGLVVPPRDPEQTARAIEQLVRDPDLRARMGKSGRKRVSAIYNWTDNVRQTIDIYDELSKEYLRVGKRRKA